MAILGSQWLLILGFLALLPAWNISGFNCHVCTLKKTPDCGRGTKPVNCTEDAISDSFAELYEFFDNANKENKKLKNMTKAKRATDYMCVTAMGFQGAFIRGCVSSARRFEPICTVKGGFNCTFCTADVKDKACNGVEFDKFGVKGDDGKTKKAKVAPKKAVTSGGNLMVFADYWNPGLNSIAIAMLIGTICMMGRPKVKGHFMMF